MWRRFTTLLLFAVLAEGVARADLTERGAALFADNCRTCHHDPGKLREQVMAHKSEGTKGNARLRAWLEDPRAVDGETWCGANRLDPNQREIMHAFLDQPTDPTQRENVRAVVPAARHRGYSSEPVKREPKRGQGDHR